MHARIGTGRKPSNMRRIFVGEESVRETRRTDRRWNQLREPKIEFWKQDVDDKRDVVQSQASNEDGIPHQQRNSPLYVTAQEKDGRSPTPKGSQDVESHLECWHRPVFIVRALRIAIVRTISDGVMQRRFLPAARVTFVKQTGRDLAGAFGTGSRVSARQVRGCTSLGPHDDQAPARTARHSRA